jgi:hypothetical protein
MLKVEREVVLRVFAKCLQHVSGRYIPQTVGCSLRRSFNLEMNTAKNVAISYRVLFISSHLSFAIWHIAYLSSSPVRL